MLHQLPAELAAAVLSHLDTASVARACLVSRAWHAVAAPMLYERITITSMDQRKRFYDFCEQQRLEVFSRQRTDSALDLPAAEFGKKPASGPLARVRRFSFGLEPSNTTDNGFNASAYGAQWKHRFVSTLLQSLPDYVPQLEDLDAAGCQFFDTVLETVLLRTRLRRLSLAFSSVRDAGLSAVSEHCGSLREVNLSGLFQLRRNDPRVVLAILRNCPDIRAVHLADCPDFWGNSSLLGECLAARPRVSLFGCPDVPVDFPGVSRATSGVIDAQPRLLPPVR